jgi:excisionase family DNA binding protein
METNEKQVPQLLTLKQAASHLAVSARTLEREIQRGRFPRPLKIGRSTRVELAAVLRYIDSLRPQTDSM